MTDTTEKTEPHKPPAPLDGLVVCDLSRVLAGPYCSMLLADLGATVIKVESAAGDDTRQWAPPDKDGVATYYLAINRNKRSVVADYRDPDDIAMIHELFRRSDIVIENFKVGGLEKYQLDFETARSINPALVYLSISGFGTAEGAGLPGYDLVVQAVSGLMSLTGEPDGPPFRAGISVFDVMTGLHGLIGVLAALEQRHRTGEGQLVEVNLLTSALSGLVNQTAAFTAGGVVPFRMGNAHPSVYPYLPLPAKDRDVIIAVGNDRQFRSLCEILGLPEVADDERFALNTDRADNRADLQPLLEAELAKWTADDLFLKLNTAGVPCGPINSIGEGVELAERLGLHPRVTMGDNNETVDLIRNPIDFSAAAPRYELPPPALGEHSERVRAWLAAPNGDPGARLEALLEDLT
jgi:crotonobetainyl-CoA:carnitine CoA-transferase CaiB-like acyl-CoA transferase